MKKLIFVSALCMSLAYCVDRHNQSQKIEASRQEAKKAQLEHNKMTVKALVDQYSANYDWYTLFDRSDAPFRRRVMQADLENAWLGKSPVMFLGRFDDYKNADGDRYQVTFTPDIFSFGPFVSGVGLDITAPKSLIEKFLNAHPEALSPTFGSKSGTVAVIAKISSVETRWEGQGEDAEEVRYGVGELLDLRFIEGRGRFRKSSELFSDSDSP